MSDCSATGRGSADSLRILVLGYVVRCPVGGMAWHHLQYVSGLVKLGHEVLFLEDSGEAPWCCYNPVTGENGADPDYGIQFTRAAFERIGLPAIWAYRDSIGGRWFGPAKDKVRKFCADADLLINLSGANRLFDYLFDIPVRAYLDTDPLFTQIRNLQDEGRRRAAAAHTVHFSFGENIADGSSDVPDDGVIWLPTRQPVDLALWPPGVDPPKGGFTTVMQWDSYQDREHQGISYGMKSRSFAPYMALPSLVDVPMELALGSDHAPREDLLRAGWRIRDPLAVTRSLDSYQTYLAQSQGEFSVAKHGYVAASTGWFSERSACYLASGRPVVVEDTGFRSRFAECPGILAFSTPEEAVELLRAVSDDYAARCRAAREAAVTWFDSSRVLASLIDRCFEGPEQRLT